MKIAILGPAPPWRGGISLFALHLARAYRECGHEVRFFTFKSQYPALLFPGKEQLDPTLESRDIVTDRSLTPWLPWTWESTVSKLNLYRPDLVLVSWFLPFFAPAYAYILRRVKPTTKVILAHNVSAHESWPLADRLTYFVFSTADRIVVLSKASQAILDKKAPLHIARKAVIGFHPIYSHATQKSDVTMSQEKSKTLLFFGLIKPYKGLDVLLAAMPAVVKAIPTIKLLVAGEVYGDSSVYLNQIQSLGIANSVECHFRYISENEISGFFARAGLCVLPYKSASQSGVIATSYSFGVPALASEVGGLGEYVVPGETGYLVVPNSPAELAAAIIKHFCDAPDMRENIEAYCQKFSWQKLAELTLNP